LKQRIVQLNIQKLGECDFENLKKEIMVALRESLRSSFATDFIL